MQKITTLEIKRQGTEQIYIFKIIQYHNYLDVQEWDLNIFQYFTEPFSTIFKFYNFKDFPNP